MRNRTVSRFRWGLSLMWFGAAMALVLAQIVLVAASRYMRPDLAVLLAIPVMVTAAGAFLILIAVPVVAILAGSVKVLPEIRRAIEGRDFEWAQRLIGLARRSARSGRAESAWSVELNCLEGAFLYKQGDYNGCLDRVTPVFRWAAAAGDVALARDSGYYLMAAMAAMERHYDVLSLSARVEAYFTLHREPYDARRLAQIQYLAAQSVAALDRSGEGGWLERRLFDSPAEA
ncbi:MAG: hypothetical protein R2762_00050 [Bryobacteraceae bacterium]